MFTMNNISINQWLTDSWQMWSLLKLMYLVQTKLVNVWRAMYEHRTAQQPTGPHTLPFPLTPSGVGACHG
jgi:hypothetical protein